MPLQRFDLRADLSHMKNTIRITLILGSTTFVTVFSFQNCAGGFIPTDSNASSLSSTGPTINDTGALGAQLYNAAGTTSLPPNSLAVGTTYMLHASGAGILNAAIIWDLNATKNGASCSLGGTGNLLVETVTCAAAGTSEVDITSYWDDGSISTAAITLTVGGTSTAPTTGTPGATPANLINFTITAGTGNNSWNTQASPVVGFVGQTLRITNNDTTTHQLHTNGSPCGHQPSASATGAHYDCALATAHAANAGDLYDHNVGTNAAFYLQVYDGPALYTTGSAGNCAACHGGLVGSAKHGATFTRIKNAISSVGAMSNIQLSDDQIRAIAFSLSL